VEIGTLLLRVSTIRTHTSTRSAPHLYLLERQGWVFQHIGSDDRRLFWLGGEGVGRGGGCDLVAHRDYAATNASPSPPPHIHRTHTAHLYVVNVYMRFLFGLLLRRMGCHGGRCAAAAQGAAQQHRRQPTTSAAQCDRGARAISRQKYCRIWGMLDA